MLREVVLNLEMWIGNNRDNLRQQLLERGERIYDVAHGRNRFFVLSEMSYADNYTIYPRFGSRAGSFLTQRRKGAEKRASLCFLKVIFIFATPYKRYLIGEDSVR